MFDVSNLSSYSDKELLDAADGCQPDGDRIAELVSRYMKTVFACAAKYAKSADYEDLVSDGMQGLLAAIRTYDASIGEFSTYAGVCIDNRMKNVAKKSLSHAAHLTDSDASIEEMERVPDTAPTPEELVMQREDDRVFFENMKCNLSEMELHCIEGVIMGFSYDEIAARLGTDRKSVDNALYRARAKLRQIYKL